MMMVLDNYLSDPSGERFKAVHAEYKPIEHTGVHYKGICVDEDIEGTKKFSERLGIEKGDYTVFWRRYLKDEENGTYIHNDWNMGSVSGVLFLNPPNQVKGGLAFWKHKKTGFFMNPTGEQVVASGFKNDLDFWNELKEDGLNQSKWEMIDYVPMEFNRMVLFNAALFHSRYPYETFGTCLEDAKLVKIYFLKHANKSL